MKRLLILTLLTITFIACSETDEALDPTEESLSEQEQLNTAILQLIPWEVLNYNRFSNEHSFLHTSTNLTTGNTWKEICSLSMSNAISHIRISRIRHVWNILRKNNLFAERFFNTHGFLR